MNETIWLDIDNLPYTVRSPRDILRFKNWKRGCELWATIPMASWRDNRTYLHYLFEGQAFDGELWFEHDDNNINFDD